jgi:hypothetical protein
MKPREILGWAIIAVGLGLFIAYMVGIVIPLSMGFPEEN